MSRRPRLPGLRVEAGGATTEGREGSYTWRGMAVDRLLEFPPNPLTIERGSEVRFVGEGTSPDEIFLSVYTDEAVEDFSLSVTTTATLDSEDPTWSAELDPGRYVVAVSRSWGKDDAVLHYFGLVVSHDDH
jgi:hypothetical protein